MRCRLEGIHFAVAGHGARVIERKRRTQARIAPRRDRQGTDLTWLTPIMPRKLLWTTAVPLRVSFDPPPVVKFGEMVMSVTSGQLNSELKSVRGFGLPLGVGFGRSGF